MGDGAGRWAGYAGRAMQDRSPPQARHPSATSLGLRRRQARARALAHALARAHAQARCAAASQDELLQGLQGLVLQLQAIADELPPQAAARRGLERVMGHADGLLARAAQARRAAVGNGRLRRLWRWLRSAA